ncbi:unnamed protein product [Rhizophagus irregularis]|uniref:Uncharacterized protein n=2 Tax=Rhizophagus irregularis TaxID=588596 RepID=A0A915ZJN5_9GLOM|nr:unnamed protein product [Rhizophagus irregularis]CAB5377319.1 unnamed protein product [Rhizophagus irregularis]
MSLQQVPNNIKRSRVTNQNFKPLAQKPISTPFLQNQQMFEPLTTTPTSPLLQNQQTFEISNSTPLLQNQQRFKPIASTSTFIPLSQSHQRYKHKPLVPMPTSTPLLQNEMPCQETSDFNSKLLVEHGMNNLVVPSLNTHTTSLNTHPVNEINKVYIELDDYENDDTEVYLHKENMNVGNLETQSKWLKKPGEKKRKIAESQVTESWNDEETDKLLSYLEDNYEKFQQGKKASIYNSISTEVIKTKSSESIKGRIKRLLEKYEKVVKKKKSSIESLIDIMNDINQSKLKISEQKLELEREKIGKDFQLQMEKLDVEKKRWEFEREQARMLHELTIKKIELQLKQCK